MVAAVSPKDAVMFEQTIQHHQPVQMYSTIEKKDIAPDKGSNVTEFPFCYNVNMLQKVHQTQASSPTTTAVASITADDKTCYRLDVGQPFGYNYALVNQMSLAAAASTATFKCETCGLVFAHLSLLNHHKRIHSDDNLSPERTFPNEQSNEIKVQLKTAAKSRNCNRCGGEVVGCEHSNNSKKKVSKFVKCENCQTGPTSTTTATTNGSISPSPHDPTESLPEIINIPNKGLHLVKRHNGVATITKCHKCNGSGIIFIGGKSPPTSDKPFRCNVCDGSFSRYSSLWSHKRLHTGDKPFKCEMCGLTFARAAYLKNHLRVHSGEKPYKCNVCGMQFSQSPHLKNHERIHSGERPYQCEVCEKTFARHSTLWNHRRIHTGEKPYRCSVCGSAFNQATHLKNHAKVHTGEKPHRCDICEVGFSDRFALKRHRLIHEKYCRTSSNNSQTQIQPSQSSSSSQNQQSTSQLEMYKCEVAFPGQQPSVSTNPQQQPQETDPIEFYKCDVATTVAFPGSEQSVQSNSTRSSQQQSDIYKCDVGTSVSFPAQQQQTPQATSDDPPSSSQNPITEVYKVSVGNSTSLPFQNQSQQQTNQIGVYKYEVGASVPYSNQGQQSQQSTSQPPSSSAPSQQIAPLDVGSSTVDFPGQNQQTPQQTSLSTPSQQMSVAKIGSSSYSEDRDGDTILGGP